MSKRGKILIVAPFSLLEEGGAATVVHGLIRAYRARGAEVVIAARAGGDVGLSTAGHRPGALSQWRDVSTPANGRTLVDLATEHAADAVHLHNFAAGVSAAAAADVARALPTVLTLHDHYALCHRGGFVRDSGQLCPGPGARCLFCVGRRGLRELHRPGRVASIRALLGAPLTLVSPSADGRRLLEANGYKNAVTISNGVDLELFQERAGGAGGASADRPLSFLAVGRASRVKGVRVARDAVDALQRMGGPPAHLLWIGPRAAAAARSLGGSTFTGRDAVRHAELPALLQAADVVLVPSLARETFGLAAAEAMACGRPVIASDHGGLREVVGDCGLLVPPGDSVALAGAMLELANDPARRAELGHRAALRARTLFPWAPLAERYLELLLPGRPVS